MRAELRETALSSRRQSLTFRIDMRIDQLVLVENKTVEKILPIHLAQLLTHIQSLSSLKN